jgi:hypothetical protein
VRESVKRGAALALFGLLTIGTAFYALVQIQGPSPLSVANVRLGMTLTEARNAMPGRAWTTRVDTSGDVVVEAEDVALHFHEGMLVAALLDRPSSSPDASGPPLQVTDFALLRRSDRPGARVHVELISRTCPTHRDLVAQILRENGISP